MFLLMGTNMLGAVIGFAVLGLLYIPQLATISTSLFGGTAPAVNDWLAAKTGNALVPAFSMMAACVIGAIALIKVPETTRCPLNGTAKA